MPADRNALKAMVIDPSGDALGAEI